MTRQADLLDRVNTLVAENIALTALTSTVLVQIERLQGRYDEQARRVCELEAMHRHRPVPDNGMDRTADWASTMAGAEHYTKVGAESAFLQCSTPQCRGCVSSL